MILKQLSEDYLSTDRHEQVAGDLSRRLPDVAEAFSRVCALADTDVGDTIIANLLEQGFRVFHRLLPYNERVNIGNGVTSREGMSDLTLMRAHHLMGSGLACQAKATEAAEHYVKAQAALDRVVERYPDRLADELRLRSDQAWRLNDERRYDEAKVKFEAAYAKEDWLQFDGLTFSLLDGLLPLVDGLGSAWLHCEKPDAWKALWFFEQGLSMIRHVCGTGVVHHYVGVCLRGVGEACTILYEQLRQQAEAARAQGEPHQALEGKAEEYAARARRDLVESLAFAEERGPRTHVALSKHGLGRLLHERGEHAAARAMLQGALQVCHETNWTLLRLEVLEDLTCNCLDEARKLGQERNALAKKCKSGGVHLMVEAYLEFADGLQDTPRWRANDGSKTDEVV